MPHVRRGRLPSRSLLGFVLVGLVAAGSVDAEEVQEVIWKDGSKGPAPEDKLLSDNVFYWGEVVLTGVEYTYEVEPDAPADDPVIERREGMPGRRLLNGVRESHSTARHPVGIRDEPLAVVFDFKDTYEFTEVDVNTPTGAAAIEVAVRDEPDEPWQTVHEQSLDDSGEGPLHRRPLDDRPGGRYVRLQIEAEGSLTRSDGVWIWGEPAEPEQVEEAIEPLAETPQIVGYSFQSIAGIGRSGFSDMQFWTWLDAMGGVRDESIDPVVWSQASTWGEITNRPLLPDAEARFETLELLMSRNETEAATVALTNTHWREPREVTVGLSEFRDADSGEAAPALEGELRVFGAVSSKYYGSNLVPMFEPDNMLGRSLMHRYVSNAETILDFPSLHLTPAGSAVMWLSVTTDNADPGIYEAELTVDGVEDGPTRTVRVEVVDVTLPDPYVWIHSYSDMTHMRPFMEPEHPDRDVAYKQSLGITVWIGLRDGPEWRQDLARRALETGQRTMLYTRLSVATHPTVRMARRGELTPDDLDDEAREAISERIEEIVADAEALGLDYEDWYLEFWDEPGMGNARSYGVLAEFIKEEVDPDVQIFMNPLFWTGGFVLEPDTIYPELADWYREYIDISVPIILLVEDESPLMDLFVADRKANAFYAVATHHARSESAERIEFYRMMAWKAMRHGMNGWGFYSYHRPRGNPWDDHGARPNYQMVYPGPRGPIPTRASEALRQGWEDYRLLTLLKEQGQNSLVDELIEGYRVGDSFDALRERALRAAAGHDGS